MMEKRNDERHRHDVTTSSRALFPLGREWQHHQPPDRTQPTLMFFIMPLVVVVACLLLPPQRRLHPCRRCRGSAASTPPGRRSPPVRP